MKIFQKFKLDGYFDNFIKKYKDYPITLYFDFPISYNEIDTNRINLFMIHEPNEIFGIHDWVYQNHKLFDIVLSWDKNLANSIQNGIEFMCSWRINNNSAWEFLGEKKFEITFLSGIKKITEGHKLRHKIYNLDSQIKPPHRWYYVLEDWDVNTNTRPGYSEYSKDLSYIPKEFQYEPNIYGKKHLYQNSMFNVSVENLKKENWINDRLWSCFASKVVPIYWGCPNVEEFGYDERGIIRFENEKDLLNILNNLTEKDYYDKLLYIEHNYQINKFDTLENRLSYFLDELIKLNNL
jgi:hypothetical protein